MQVRCVFSVSVLVLMQMAEPKAVTNSSPGGDFVDPDGSSRRYSNDGLVMEVPVRKGALFSRVRIRRGGIIAL